MAPERVKLKARSGPTQKTDDEYPWIIFRRITENENNQVKHAGPRVEISIIGLRGSATKGDDLLESIKDTLKDYFMDKTKTWGKYAADGTPDPSGGLRMRAYYISTVDDWVEELDETAQTMIWRFTYLRS